jgi:hypothetical protein
VEKDKEVETEMEKVDVGCMNFVVLFGSFYVGDFVVGLLYGLRWTILCMNFVVDDVQILYMLCYIWIWIYICICELYMQGLMRNRKNLEFFQHLCRAYAHGKDTCTR